MHLQMLITGAAGQALAHQPGTVARVHFTNLAQLLHKSCTPKLPKFLPGRHCCATRQLVT